MPPPDTVTLAQRQVLLYVQRYETPEYGVIVRFGTGDALVKRGYLQSGNRRPRARTTGICVRLTDKGRTWCEA